MRSARIYTANELITGSIVELDGSAARHINQVLRKRVGDTLVLLDGRGSEFAATIRGVDKKGVHVNVGEQTTTTTESDLQLSLWHGLCRGGRMDSVIQKATELGVTSIQPILTARGVVKFDQSKAPKRVQHWQTVAISACEQSGRNQLPEIHTPLKLTEALVCLDDGCCAILLHPDGHAKLDSVVTAGKPTIVLTGPEGGFTEDEVRAATEAGFTSVALGSRIMRTETAPIVALGLVQYLAGDLAGRRPGEATA
jgi:16S rRNA (uracil1498-N3)-methyltransferase